MKYKVLLSMVSHEEIEVEAKTEEEALSIAVDQRKPPANWEIQTAIPLFTFLEELK